MSNKSANLTATACGAILAAMCAAPAMAQEVNPPENAPPEIDMENTAFSGDYLSVGAGVAVSPSYTGSDDYVFNALPIVQGSLGGVDISPRAAGLKLDFIQDPAEGVGFDLGVAGRLRSNRAQQIEDEIVEQYGELDRAIEVGPTAGVSFPKVLNPYDSLTVSTDVLWDINGAHDGVVVSPSISYFTPLSRSMIASLSVSAEWADESFQNYYFRVEDADFIGSSVGDMLPEFQPEGSGFTNAGVNLLLGFDLDGDLTNGGLGLIVVGGYSRVLGDAKDTPFTDLRGSKDQFLGAVGIGYTF